MIRQSAGFALFGSLLAILGMALGGGTRNEFGGRRYVTYVGSGSISSGEQVYVIVAATGAVIGLVVGAALWSAGLRMTGSAGNRIVRVVAAGLTGASVGLSPTLVLLGGAFANADWANDLPYLVFYAISAVASYCLAIGAVYVILRAAGDRNARRTAVALTWLLPIGAALATIAGMATAYALGYTTVTSTWVAVIVVVLVVLTTTFVAARAFALHGTERESES